MNARRQAKRALLSPSAKLNVVLSCPLAECSCYLSFFNAKYTTYLIIILKFSKQFWDSYLSTHSIYYYYFLILKIYQKHIIMGIFFFQLPRSFPKFLTRLSFFPVLVLTTLLRRFTFARIDISYARFFFLRKRGKSTIICTFKLRGF